MALTFHDKMAADAAKFLSHFAESIVYMPYAGGQRTISAIVNRNLPAMVPGMPLATAGSITIEVANSATTGVSLTELDKGGDKFLVAETYGGTPKEMTVVSKPEEDSAMLTLEVRYGVQRI